jgi:hypothetical protein
MHRMVHTCHMDRFARFTCRLARWRERMPEKSEEKVKLRAKSRRDHERATSDESRDVEMQPRDAPDPRIWRKIHGPLHLQATSMQRSRFSTFLDSIFFDRSEVLPRTEDREDRGAECRFW